MFDKINNRNNMPSDNNYDDLSYRFDLFKGDILTKMDEINNNFVKRNEIINMKNELDNKANIIDVQNALNTKEDKDKIIPLLNSKMDITEIQDLLEAKAEKNEILDISRKLDEKLNKNEFEQFLDEYRNDVIKNSFANKVDIKEFKLLTNSYNEFAEKTSKKIDDIDSDLDRLIDTVKEQFKSVNMTMTNLDQNKIDANEVDADILKNLDNILKSKADKEELNNIITKIKNSCLEVINKFKNGENANMEVFEDNINNKIDKITYDNQSMLNEITNTNQNINNYFTQKEAEMERLITKIRSLISDSENIKNNFNNNNGLQEDRLKSEINNMIENNNNKILQKFDEKMDIIKFQEFLNDLKEDLDRKIDLDTMKKNNDEIINKLNKKISELYTDINSQLLNKLSKDEIGPILSNKLDSNYNKMLNNNNLLNDKLSITDFKEYIDNISSELKQKLDINKFNNIISTFNSNFENIHKDMNSKADVKNVLELAKNKLDTDNFNKVIKSIQKDINTKVNNNDFSNAMDNQAIINDTLCNENNLGRWLWKSGKVKNNLGVPWEIQIINTSPDNFKWEKDKSVIIINEGGLYEINLGFYADKKPMVQILLNGEVVVNGINNNSSAMQQSTGGRMKGIGKTSFGNITGLTMVDFIILPDKAKLSISYNGEEGIGFLGLKKL